MRAYKYVSGSVCDGMTRAYEVMVDDGTYTVFKSTHTTTGSERSPVAVFKDASSDVADSYMGTIPDIEGDPIVYVGGPDADHATIGDLSEVPAGVFSVLDSYDVTLLDASVYTVEMSDGETHRFMDVSDCEVVSAETPSKIPA